jgi:ComF family protein
MFFLKRYTNDLVNLLFPEICNGCGELLYQQEKTICTKCLYDLPFTDFHLYADNPVAKMLWGRTHLHSATSLLYFKKGSKVQSLIHQLKYNGKSEVGVLLGKLLARKLKESELFASITGVIPVPLHEKKLRTRGYNQSDFIAEGIAEELNIPVNKRCLIRSKATESQTKKARFSRFENMQTVFTVIPTSDLGNEHFLMVDDVITTGSTIEACGNALLNNGLNKLSIATLAFAQ